MLEEVAGVESGLWSDNFSALASYSWSSSGSRGPREHQVEPNSVTTVVKGGRRSNNISSSITGSYGTGHSRASSRIIAAGRTTIVTVTIVYGPPSLEILS
ncbi:hypothetical protein N7524_000764 [Penicillium chrysogenum]|nr:hypothetical protein N7524_000764 [Penicillium chrysogenum]